MLSVPIQTFAGPQDTRTLKESLRKTGAERRSGAIRHHFMQIQGCAKSSMSRPTAGVGPDGRNGLPGRERPLSHVHPVFIRPLPSRRFPRDIRIVNVRSEHQTDGIYAVSSKIASSALSLPGLSPAHGPTRRVATVAV